MKFGVLIAAWRTYRRNIKGRKFEPEIKFLKNLLNKGDICLHIGASDARHTYIMSNIIEEDGHVYAFEPSSYSFEHLSLMVKLHRLKNVECYHMAISDKSGTVCLMTPQKSTGHAGRSFAFIARPDNTDVRRTDIESSTTSKEEVEAISIDNFIDCFTCFHYNGLESINRLDFIRCDTEGSEMLILKGAINTIEKYKPNFLIEIHTQALKNVFESSAKEVVSFLIEKGYRMFREDSGKISEVNEVDESEIWKDYFFIHSSRINSLPMGPFSEILVCQ